ncbi:MAG: glycosyltransferase family 2 protein [Ignavibacterium album]|uniref:glycosyltransferase family 2 protein n=1 Tax=Ignavibacterium album TaxID=591197 RepID=UPI0026EEC62E|nr:glycosyltransferase family 2 protein [Ignavibacterium album]MCX8105113.1 glycosyltransferase family 2 protein [Ignavibacterium album]
MDVSVIIVNYNNFNLLRNCLESLYKHTHDLEFEVIVVDNGSSEAGLENICSTYDNLILIKNKENLGFSKANNIGLSLAKGKYVLFLNNDTIFKENSIKKILDYAQETKNVIIGCKLLNVDESWQQSTANFPTILNSWSSNFFLYLLFPNSPKLNKYYLKNRNIKEITEVDYVLGAFMFGLRKDFIDLNGFDERFYFYSEDIDLCYRYKKMGGKIILFPFTSIIHIGGASVESNHWFKIKNKFISEIQFFQKHSSGLSFFLSIIPMYLGNLIRFPLFLLLGIFMMNKNFINRSISHLRLTIVYPKNLFQ